MNRTKKDITYNNGIYQLLNTTLTVEYVDRVVAEDGHWIYGQTFDDRGGTVLRISINDEDGDPLPKEQIETTLRHELFHFILGTLYFNEENNNETLVEWLANATQILHKQGLNI